MEGDKEAQSAVFQEACRTYIEAFQSDWHERMSKKLGFKSWKGSTSEEDEESSDEGLMKRMFAAMGEVQVDFTNFFRSLAKIDSTTGLEEALSIVRSTMGAGAGFDEDAEDEVSDEAVSVMREWLSEYLDRLAVDAAEWDNAERVKTMNANNPKYIPRNHLLHVAIEVTHHVVLDFAKQRVQCMICHFLIRRLLRTAHPLS